VSYEIVPFRPEHARAWYALNRAWLDEHHLYEPADERQLADPVGTILNAGGAIFIALRGREVVGTAAIAPHGPGELELIKLTVHESARRTGLGRRLAETCLAHARTLGAARVVLVSSSRLGAAIKLYESMGFEHGPMPAGVPYATADVYMLLALPAPRGPATDPDLAQSSVHSCGAFHTGCGDRGAGRKIKIKFKSVAMLQHRADHSEWLWDTQWPAMLPRPCGHRPFTRRDRRRAGTLLWGAPTTALSQPCEKQCLVQSPFPAPPNSPAVARPRD
jgi:putative acetyltransferase